MTEILGYFLLKNYLMKYYGYTGKEAAGLMRRIREMKTENKKALKAWVNGDGMKTRTVSGITAGDIHVRLGYNPVVSFVILDWLEKDPDMASMFLLTPQERLKPLVTEEDKKRIQEKIEKSGIVFDEEFKRQESPEDMSDIDI